MEKNYLILAYYQLFAVENPQRWVKEHKKFFKDRDVTGRLYISEEGINGQMSGLKEDCEAYMQWMKATSGCENIFFKIDPSHENVFFKMTVKYREQLVAFDEKLDLQQVGHHMSPQDWRKHLESDEKDYLLIDVRNDYETDIGHFEGAERPQCNSFREFKDYTEKELIEKRKLKKDQKILMYCTGGIRCEYYSAYMKEKGFENIHQLDGGVVNYAHQQGDNKWKGKLFVFDDRLVTRLGDKKECLTKCKHCGAPADHYYNCANMDCNNLFICCSNCLELHKGCCETSCMEAKRLRPLSHFDNKPFRKWYHHLPDAKS